MKLLTTLFFSLMLKLYFIKIVSRLYLEFKKENNKVEKVPKKNEKTIECVLIPIKIKNSKEITFIVV